MSAALPVFRPCTDASHRGRCAPGCGSRKAMHIPTRLLYELLGTVDHPALYLTLPVLSRLWRVVSGAYVRSHAYGARLEAETIDYFERRYASRHDNCCLQAADGSLWTARDVRATAKGVVRAWVAKHVGEYPASHERAGYLQKLFITAAMVGSAHPIYVVSHVAGLLPVLLVDTEVELLEAFHAMGGDMRAPNYMSRPQTLALLTVEQDPATQRRVARVDEITTGDVGCMGAAFDLGGGHSPGLAVRSNVDGDPGSTTTEPDGRIRAAIWEFYEEAVWNGLPLVRPLPLGCLTLWREARFALMWSSRMSGDDPAAWWPSANVLALEAPRVFAALVADRGHLSADVPEHRDAEGNPGTAVAVHRFPRADLPEYVSCTPADFRPVMQNHLRAPVDGVTVTPDDFISSAAMVVTERL